MEFGRIFFREIDLIDFMSFFGVDFFKFSGPFCVGLLFDLTKKFFLLLQEVLDYNEGDHFKLVYDDLPIYYVPEALKVYIFLFTFWSSAACLITFDLTEFLSLLLLLLQERLYLMANLFTKYHVSDELAFPLLLRGLEKTENWTKLSRSELTEKEITEPKINKPEVSSDNYYSQYIHSGPENIKKSRPKNS